MGMILDYIEQAGKGKYQCFKTKKICLDSVDNDTIAYNYDDKTIANFNVFRSVEQPKTIRNIQT